MSNVIQYKYTLLIAMGFLFSILIRTETFGSAIPSGPSEIILFSCILLVGLQINENLKLTKSSLILFALLSVILIYSVLTSLWALYPRLTVQRAFLTFTLPIILLLIVAIDNQKKYTFKILSHVVVAYGVLFALIGIFLHIFGDVGSSGGTTIQYVTIGPIELSQNIVGRESRISSILGNPNTLAGFFVMSIPLTVVLYFNHNKKILYVILLVLQISALLLSGSRNGFFAVISSLIVISVLVKLDELSKINNLLRSSPKILGIVAMVFGAIPVASSIFSEGRFIDISADALEGSNRLEMWTAIWHYFIGNPQGTGFGISREVIPGVMVSAHSDYFVVLGELGIVGVVFFSLIITITVWYGLRSYIHAPVNKRLYLAGAIAVFVGFTIHGFAETTITRGGGRQIFWAYSLAYIVCYSKDLHQL